MQKNNLCPLSNKVLLYEEIDTFSQSTFNPNKLFFGSSKKPIKQIKQKYIANIANKINPIHKINNDINNNKNISKKIHINNNFNINSYKTKGIILIIKQKLKNLKIYYKKTFELNFYIFSISYLINKYKMYDKNNNNDELIKQFYSYNDSIKIIPKKEFYFKHHMIFLERPNFKNIYFNNLKKNLGLEKLNIYQNHKKKDNKIEQININNENENNKIFDTNVLETIENYSTTITQSSNNEKHQTLTPFEILKRCEDTNKKKKDLLKNNDQKSIITFSESEISYKSKNIIDESIIAVVQDLSEKPNKFKQYKNEKKYTNFFIKKKDIQKLTKNNKNNNTNINNNNINNIKLYQNNKNNNNANFNCNKINKINNNNNDDKELINKKRISTSINKKTKKIVNDNNIYQNTISKSSPKKASFINNITSNKLEETKKTNFTSFGKMRKNKGVLNLKKESYKIKNHATKFSDNYLINDNSNNNINNINNINNNNSKLASASYNNIDKLLTFFLTPKNKNQTNDKSKSKYAEFSFNNVKRRQVKKNTTLTINNNNIINNSENSQEKYKNIKNNSTFKSKSPLTRLFLKKNEYEANSKKKNTYKKKKSVLIPELEHNSQLAKSINKYFFEKNKDENKNISSNNVFNSINNNNNNNAKHFNIMTLSHGTGTNRRNSYQFMKLNKRTTKGNLLK